MNMKKGKGYLWNGCGKDHKIIVRHPCNPLLLHTVSHTIKNPFMKCIISLACIILFIFACKKENKSPVKNKLVSSGYTVTDSASLKGFWELRILYGCQTPNCNPFFEPGNGNTYQFTDSTYTLTIKSTSPAYSVADSGRYTTGKDTSQVTGSYMDFIRLKDDPYRRFIEIVKDTLTIYDGYIPSDGSIQKYVRF
jgi:hypothetical protein